MLRRTMIIVLMVALVAVSLAAPAVAAPDTGLVAHYAFDEERGTVVKDHSAGAHDGTIHDATRVKALSGRGLAFDGKSAYVECGDGKRLKLDRAVTVCAWIRPKGKPKGEPIVAGEGTALWGLTHYKGRVYFYISGGGNHCKANVPYHQWTHVAGAFDGQRLRLYLNGELAAQRDLKVETPIKTGTTFRIGGGKKGTDFFDGIIDDVRVYSRVLSEEELTMLATLPDSDAA